MNEVGSHGSSQHLLKQGGRTNDGSTNTSVDSYAEFVSLPTIACIPNNDKYDIGPMVSKLNEIVKIVFMIELIRQKYVRNKDPQFLINEIRRQHRKQIITSYIASKTHHSSRWDYNIKVQAHIQRK